MGFLRKVIPSVFTFLLILLPNCLICILPPPRQYFFFFAFFFFLLLLRFYFPAINPGWAISRVSSSRFGPNWNSGSSSAWGRQTGTAVATVVAAAAGGVAVSAQFFLLFLQQILVLFFILNTATWRKRKKEYILISRTIYSTLLINLCHVLHKVLNIQCMQN